eukprot:4918199-Ditylum_brightwellii.AAC.1
MADECQKRDIDKDSTGEIDFDKSLKIVMVQIGDKGSKEDIQKAFSPFDDDGTGFISLQNLKQMAKELGDTASDADLLEMIERTNKDQDGQISLDEFYAIMTKTSFV